MGIDAGSTRLRRGVWAPALTVVVLLALALGLLRAHGAAGPPRPVLSAVRLPEDPTTSRSASFMFTNSQSVTFECALDDATFSNCGSGVFGAKAYAGPLPLGLRRFAVRARSGRLVSAPTGHVWTVVASGPKPVEPGGDDDSDGDEPVGDGSSAEADGLRFEISGRAAGLVPGLVAPIVLTLRNPGLVPISVTRVAVRVDRRSDPPGCPSSTNLVLAQANGISATGPVRIPARGTVVLRTPPRVPTVALANRPWNQDACKEQTFRLVFTGSGRS